ncbi:MAG: prolipoprotein diacylglyceryl transferase [Planctomycetes bacterium]|nr:prolipoprotein diacylglyceryl transferase [Planctomycetota bacterium]
MYPRIGPVPTYSIFYLLGIVTHFLICYFIAKRLGLRHRVWIVVGICYMEGMIVGAKILYDIQNAQFDLRTLLSIRHYMQGGVWGGLLAYFILALPLVLILAKNRRGALDLVALSIPVPWIFAKIGCLFNGCCFGKESSLPWAITFPASARGAPPDVPLHPTQIYEILVVVCILVVFKKLNYVKWRGTMLLWFLALYGTGRAATEFFRGDFDHHLLVGPLTLSQLICLITAGTSIILLFLWRRFVQNDMLDESTSI